MSEQPTAPTTETADLEHDEHGHDWGSDVERVEHGFAPNKDDGNLKPREQREAEAREEAGPDIDAPLLKDGRPLTDAEETERYQRLRSYPSVPPIPTRSVIVNGVAMLVKAAEGGELPAEAREVLENTAASRRTGQMKGLGNGLRTYDLTRPDAPNPRGSASERIAASAEATTAEAETERREASAGVPESARTSRSRPAPPAPAPPPPPPAPPAPTA